MKLAKLFISLLLCCAVDLASSKSKCMHTPDTKCSKDQMVTGWFFEAAVANSNKGYKQCFELHTCKNSTTTTSYFSSKEECEEKCALKCTEPTPNLPYEPSAVVISEEVQGDDRLMYSSFITCAIGYIQIGSSKRTCDINGNWTGEELICYEIIITVNCETTKYELNSKNILEVEEGQNLMITCAIEETTSVDDLNVAWRKVKGDIVHNLPTMHDMREGKGKEKKHIYIQIDNARLVHSGTYSCMSLNNPKLSRNFTLRVKDPKLAPNIRSASVMISKGMITLSCHASGKPAPGIKWFKDGHHVHGEKNMYSTSSETLLDITIRNPDCTHIGNYTCKAKNVHGTILMLAETSVSAADIGLPELGSGEDECRPNVSHNSTHNESCNLCPRSEVPIEETCNMSSTVISAQLIVNETSINNNTKEFVIKESKVLKGLNNTSSELNMLKLTEQASECECPTLKSQTWYIFTGTVDEDMFIVSEKDILCAPSDHHLTAMESHCKSMT